MPPFDPHMQKTILLISRDQSLQASRALVLESAGYRTIRSESISDSLPFVTRAQMAIIGHSFTRAEQDDFIERALETNPSLYVLCLRFGLVQPEAILQTCHDCFAFQRGEARVYVVEENNLISWPKPAS
jgi:hypothetical protein